MNVAITGASGFIGTRLSELLRKQGYGVEGVDVRKPGWEPAVESADAVVNLAGASLFAKRWNRHYKAEIRDSRINTTRAIVQAMGSGQKKFPKPRVLISGSAIGYYGATGDEVLTENSPAGSDFLAAVCVDWEAAAEAAETKFGIRTVLLRTGVVLGPNGGALRQMLPAFKLGLGGPVASGEQWMSWIYLDDICELIIAAIHNESVRGPLNATAPSPVRNIHFTKTLGAVLGRPTVVPIPEFGLRLLFGEVAQTLTSGQRVIPEKAQRMKFNFKYEALNEALSAAVRGSSKAA